MTMKDRSILQRTIAGCARVQARADYICMRRKGESTKELEAALANDDRKDKKRGPSKKLVKALAENAAQLDAQHVALEEASAEPVPSPEGRWALDCAICNTKVLYATELDARRALITHRNTEGRHNLSVTELEPQPVAKGVEGPLGALLPGQTFFISGLVGTFILENWTLKPGAFDDSGELKKVPVVRQRVGRGRETLKPTAMTSWFEETIVTVAEDFALLSAKSSGTIQSGQKTEEANMASKKKAAKKANGAVKGRKAANLEAQEVKLVKMPKAEDKVRGNQLAVLETLKEHGPKMTAAELVKKLKTPTKNKNGQLAVWTFNRPILMEKGFITVSD